MTHDDQQDSRAQRTRLAVFNAFRELVLSRRYDDIRVADIIDGAGVGRSTFYEHFNSKDDVLLTSIEPLFAVLADIPTIGGEREKVRFVLAHFWEQRAFARIIFQGDLFDKLTRKLAEMIEQRYGEDIPAISRLRAISSAASLLGVIRGWLSAEFSMPVDELTVELMGGDGAPPRE
ncbi:TetR/AcrR family transcriptional regulator [Hyphococcus sp.]|uniref:TetR/AcrR family transcriptional regulator n=1 Tax=Hyphococcus sp. TaxID=2038636 RepID=UPI002083086D|nr:MAG: TetR family transcriptional regulator [Marinicaulis sp.]